MTGWIKLHRDLMNHYLWADKPFTRGQAWIDLLMLVNHKDGKTMIDGKPVEVKRGSKITSIRKLCDRWGWSNTKTIKFLRCLQDDKMLSYFSDKKKTVVTIVNYDLYQNQTSKKRHRNDTETTQKHTNKKLRIIRYIYTTTREKLSTVSTGEIIKSIEKEFARPLSPIELEQIGKWEEEYSKEVITEALKIMVLRGVHNLTYMDRILQGWEKRNLKTVQQVREHEEKRQNRDKPKPKSQWNVEKKDLEDLYEL